jgi:hypothetical protein
MGAEPEHSPRIASRRLLTAVVSALVTLLLIEVGLRIFRLPLPDRFFAPNPDFGWFHIPGRQGWQRTPELAVPVSISSAGLRDSEHSYQKPEGTFRILLLGDSFVEGLQVPLEHTVGKQLEARLTSAPGARVEVINGGVSRFGTDNEILFYDFEGWKYDPDLVILFFFYNDLYDNLEAPYFRLEGHELEPVLPKPQNVLGPGGELRGWLWDHSQAYRLVVVVGNLLGYLIGRAGPGEGGGGDIPFLLKNRADEAAALELTGALLEDFNEQLTSDGRRLLVVGIGEMSAVERDDGRINHPTRDINRRLGETLAKRGVLYLDLIQGFRARYASSSVSLFWPGDGHWNELGHALAAELVLEALRVGGWLPCCKG